MSFGKGLKTFRGRTRDRYKDNKEINNGIRYGEKLRNEENKKTRSVARNHYTLRSLKSPDDHSRLRRARASIFSEKLCGRS